MLYDKRWDKPEIKTDPFSLESLIAWLEKQPADGVYDWSDCNGACLIGQFLIATGIHWSAATYRKFGDENLRADIAGAEPHTFGAALARARKALAER